MSSLIFLIKLSQLFNVSGSGEGVNGPSDILLSLSFLLFLGISYLKLSDYFSDLLTLTSSSFSSYTSLIIIYRQICGDTSIYLQNDINFSESICN